MKDVTALLLIRVKRYLGRLLQLLVSPEHDKDLLSLHCAVLDSAGGSWRTVGGGCLRKSELTPWLSCTASHNFSVLTCPDENVLDHDDDADALAARFPALFRPSWPRTSITIHRESALLWWASWWISARTFSTSSLQHKPEPLGPLHTGHQAKAGSQGSPTRNSMLFWQSGEIQAKEPSLHPKMNRGPAAIHCSWQTV